MNAPLPVKVEDIDAYRSILPESFIDETLARKKLIAENKKASLDSLQKVNHNFCSMAEAVKVLGQEMGKCSDSFRRLEILSRKNSEAYKQIGATLRDLSARIKRQALSARDA